MRSSLSAGHAAAETVGCAKCMCVLHVLGEISTAVSVNIVKQLALNVRV